MTTREVTGTIRRPDGTAWSGAAVKFKLDKSTYTAAEAFPAAEVSATADGSGVFTATLWCNAEGFVKTLYTATLPDGSSFQFRLAAGNASPVDIAVLRSGGIAPATPSDPLYVSLGALVAEHEAAPDPHPGYLTPAEGDARYEPLGGAPEHGALAGLGDDDHPQYFNQARGDARYAPLSSPAFTDTPTAPTPDTSTSSTQLATTAFVHALAAAILGAPPSTLDTLQEIAAALGNDPNLSATLTTAIGTKLAKAANLSDLTDAAAARSNLGLGALALLGSLSAADVGLGSVVNAVQVRVLHLAYSGANAGAAETTLSTFTLDAGHMGADGKAVRISAFVSFAANANNKSVKVYFGSTALVSIPASSGNNGGNANYVFTVVRTGAVSQSAFGRGGVAPSNTGNENQNVNPYAVPAENTAGQIVIRVTGQGAASGDVLLRGFVVEALN